MKKLLKVFFFLLIAYSAKAQHLTHDVGVFVGSATIQTDYGQRNDFLSSYYGNNALSFSLVHYLHFFNINSRSDLANHMMIKSELNLMTKANFEHYGKYIIGNTDLARQLRAMKGSASLLNVGIQGEYYFKDLKKIMFSYSGIKLNPYISLGFKYSIYTNTLTSELGDWRIDNTVLPTKYREPGQLAVGKGSVYSFILGAGTRYKLSKKIDLAAHFNWQYFFSDAIDGLQTDHKSNKGNEQAIHFQVGIIYHLNLFSQIFNKN